MPKVLVVEDSPSARAFVRAILEEPEFAHALGGCQVTEASSGFEAMRLLPRGPYDLIITDINMAAINGLELIRFIRMSEHHRSTPLVIISTLAAQRDIDKGLALGADAYLPKPFTAEALRATCVRALGGAKTEAGSHPGPVGSAGSSGSTGSEGAVAQSPGEAKR
ncbi:response regulator [Pendulispora albinea]|uniref:Response regulator n=1 Tax=Pendulispora albinea TaxID=2741071 RepID=A0ABZ2M207_9BACT